MKTLLTKEYLELLISKNYKDSFNFDWGNSSVSFECDGEIVPLGIDERKSMNECITDLTLQITYLKGSLAQANKTLHDLMYPIIDEENTQGNDNGED